MSLQTDINAAAGKGIDLPLANYVENTTLTVPTNTIVDGVNAVIERTTGDAHIFDITTSSVTISDTAFEGVNGSDATSNSAIRVAGAEGARVIRASASGMSGSAFYSTAGSSYGRFLDLYVHGLTGNNQNASDVMLYTGTSSNIVAFGRLEGGRSTGVYMQLDSTHNKVLFNQISNQNGYGILDYDNTPRASASLILGNTVRDISGSDPIGGHLVLGAGIYTADTGGQIIAFNDLSDCNQATIDETLAPAGIGQNATHSPMAALVLGNVSRENHWYGYMSVVARKPIAWIGNLAHENAKDQFYAKNAHHPLIALNISYAVESEAERAISVNAAETSLHRGASLLGNRTLGGTLRVIELQKTELSNVIGNNSSDFGEDAVGHWLVDSSYMAHVGNVIDASASSGYAMRISGCAYSTFSSNMIRIAEETAIAVQIDEDCANSFFDKSNIIAGKPEPMNFINNESAGCIVETFGSAPPTLLRHQVGDRVWNRSAASGSPDFWRCTTAGIPGVWVASNL